MGRTGDADGGGLALNGSSRPFRASVIVVVFAILAALFSVGASTPASAAPTAIAQAAETPTGCGFATGSAGTYANTICWIDFSSYNETEATSAAGQPFTVSIGGGYTARFVLTSSPVPDSVDYPYQPLRAVPASDVQYASSWAAEYYNTTPGDPVLWNYNGADGAGASGAVIRLGDITVTGPDGQPVDDYKFVSGDAEQTASGENVQFFSDKPLSLLQSEPSSTNPTLGCTPGTTTGIGTTNTTCVGSGDGSAAEYSNELFAADAPTTIQQVIQSSSRNAGVFGFMMSKVQLEKTVSSRVSPSDSFALSVSSGTATLGTADTGTAATASTGPLTVLAGNPVTLAEVGDGNTTLSNYNAAWSCLVNGAADASITPTAGSTSTTIDGGALDVGSFIDCTITNTAKAATLGIVKHAGTPVDVNGDGLTDAGDTLAYTFTVTNTGELALSTVGVTDTKAGAVTCPETTLPVGASEICTADSPYTITAADVTNGSVDNSATAHGAPPGSTTPVTSTPSTTTTPTTTPAPALTLVKSATPSSPGSYNAGQKIAYSFTVTNTGNVPLNDITINESDFSGTGTIFDPTCPDATLAVGDQEVCTATYTLTQADVDAATVTNTATATGTPPGSTTPVPSNPSTVTIPNTPAPAITVKKTADPGTVAKAGQKVKYSFVVTNTGNVTLDTVGVTDSDFSGTGALSAIDCPDTTLVPGQAETCTATYTVTQADIDAGGTITNTATSHGTPPGSNTPTPSDPSTTTVTVTQTPAITVKKTSNVTATEVGETVTYSFLVTNTGNVTLTDPKVTDTDFSGTGTLSAISCPSDTATLAPADTEICTATYTVTQADADAGKLTNTATATATPPGQTTPPVSPPSTVIVTTDPHPAISVVKTASTKTIAQAGQKVTYTFTVTNTGNVTLTDPKVTDSKFSGTGTLSAISCPTSGSTLTAGEVEKCTATYTVTPADLVSGYLTNTATVTGSTPGGGQVSGGPSTVSISIVVPVAAAGLASTGSNLGWPTTIGSGLVLLGAVVFLGTALIRRRRHNGSDEPMTDIEDLF